ncbi:MAG: hypothetical protein QF752_16225, partial [Planctomycetota bacterium]|nr:hypothetical protein [Planctomycetota bacterium]
AGTTFGMDLEQMGKRLRNGHDLSTKFEWQKSSYYRDGGLYGLHRLRVIKGFTYTVETKTIKSASGTHDTYLYLGRLAEEVFASEDPSYGTDAVKKVVFKTIAKNDDGGEALNGRIVFTASKTETLHVLLRAYGKGLSGKCRLSVQASSAAVESSPELPDLRALKCFMMGMDGVCITGLIQEKAGKELFAFERALANEGGDLEVVTIDDGKANRAYQKLFRKDGSYCLVELSSPQLLNYTMLYALRNSSGKWVGFQWDPAVGLQDEMVYDEASKISEVYDPASLPKSEELVSHLSAGWINFADFGEANNAIDVTGLPNGKYELVLIVNPFGFLKESQTSDNWRTFPLVISGPAGNRKVKFSFDPYGWD